MKLSETTWTPPDSEGIYSIPLRHACHFPQKWPAAGKKLKVPFPSPASPPSVPPHPGSPGKQLSKAPSPRGDLLKVNRGTAVQAAFQGISSCSPLHPPHCVGCRKGQLAKAVDKCIGGSVWGDDLEQGPCTLPQAQQQPSLCSLPQR